MPKNKHKHLRENQRRVDAAYREGQRASRTNAEQLALIDQRRGNSTKERARLT